jgi:hypothetical protein
VALDFFRSRAIAEHDPALIANLPSLTLEPSVVTGPTLAAATIFRNWLEYLAKRKDVLSLAG